ncbi:uncharacterized protein METZ01_LOCUS396539 [marine metagenome]|uniref:Uncharacterized protein n=1 Tax=marine metagenome TaxID=408172 RepID=A0A382VCC7_9ZZZZ
MSEEDSENLKEDVRALKQIGWELISSVRAVLLLLVIIGLGLIYIAFNI